MRPAATHPEATVRDPLGLSPLRTGPAGQECSSADWWEYQQPIRTSLQACRLPALASISAGWGAPRGATRHRRWSRQRRVMRSPCSPRIRPCGSNALRASPGYSASCIGMRALRSNCSTIRSRPRTPIALRSSGWSISQSIATASARTSTALKGMPLSVPMSSRFPRRGRDHGHLERQGLHHGSRKALPPARGTRAIAARITGRTS